MRFVPVLLVLLPGLAAAAETSPEENKIVARRFFEEVWFRRQYQLVDDMFASEHIVHDPRFDKPTKYTIEAQKQTARYWHEQGEVSGSVDHQIAEGDRVVTQWTWRVKLNSWPQRLQAGRETIETKVVQTFRFQQGKVVEVWVLRDDYGFQEQMRASRLYYLEGFGFGVLFTLVLLRFLRRTA